MSNQSEPIKPLSDRVPELKEWKNAVIHRGVPIKIVDFFFSRLSVPDENGCILWTGYRTNQGYGQMVLSHYGYFKTQLQRAHRVSWIITNGDIPGGLFVCHKCDVRDCVNPNHLFIGTARDNMQDCKSKNRLNPPCGEKSATSKIREKDIPIIFKMRAAGVSYRMIAKLYGVDNSNIVGICKGRIWKQAIQKYGLTTL